MSDPAAARLTTDAAFKAAVSIRIDDVRVGDTVVGSQFTLPVVSVNYQARLVILGHRGYPTIKRSGERVLIAAR